MNINTTICNMAVAHLGQSVLMTDAATETTQEARSCRLFFDAAVIYVLKMFDWGSHRIYAELNLVEEEPNSEWLYSYRYPTDCVAPRKIVGSVRNPREDQQIPFVIGKDGSGQLIYTDMEDAILKYTEENDDFSTWDEDLKLAVSYYLAYLIAPQIISGDPFKLKNDMMAMFQMTMSQAAANSANQEQKDPEAESLLQSIRNE